MAPRTGTWNRVRTLALLWAGMASLAALGCGSTSVDLQSTAVWSATYESGFGHVLVRVAGKTSGERVTILTYGDGLRAEKDLALGAGGTFDEEVEIAFTHAPDTTPRTYTTTLRAYRDDASVSTELQSPELTFPVP